MNKFLLLFISLWISLNALEWKSYDEALKEANVTNKIVMIDIVRDGCHYCENMQKVVFNDTNMSLFIEKDFIPVRINISKENLPLGLHVSVTPTFIFVSKDEEIIKKVPGSWNIEDFTYFLNKVKAKEKK
jgi:thioredoxin-related protein